MGQGELGGRVSSVGAQREGEEAGLGEDDQGLGLGVLIWRFLEDTNIKMSRGWLTTRTSAQRQVQRRALSKLK